MSINRGWLNKVQLLLTMQRDAAMQKQKRLPRYILKNIEVQRCIKSVLWG